MIHVSVILLRWVCIVILFACAAVAAACSGQQGELSSAAGAAESYRLQGLYVSGPGFTGRLKKGRKLSAQQSVVARLSQDTPTRPVELAVSGDTELQTVLVFLLSADEARVPSLSLRSSEQSIEVALPNDERWPSAAAADVYLSVGSERLSLGHQLSDLTEEKGADRSAPLTDDQALSKLFARFCAQGRCRHAVLASAAENRWERLEPVLASLRAVLAPGGSLRLMSNGEQATGGAAGGAPALPAAEVQRTVNAHRAQLELCHQGGPEGVEARGGTLLVSFIVTPLGIIFDAQVDGKRSTISEPDIVACVEDAFTRMKFPRPKSETALEYLVRF